MKYVNSAGSFANQDYRLSETPDDSKYKFQGHSDQILQKWFLKYWPVDADGHLISGADFSQINAYPTNRLVRAQSTRRPQAGQIVSDGNKYLLKISDQRK